MIEIKCTGSDTIDIDQLTEFQGALKERDAGDVEKIIKSIKKHGFSFPFFVWAHAGENGAYINHVFDGHGRLMALKKLRAQGEEIPELPCVYVSAKNEAEAKELLLKLNSQYGHMTAESVADFLDGMEIELDDLALPDGVLDLSGIAAPEEETEGDDDAPDVDEDGEPDSQPGEMYELGNSILLCGDSTNAEDVARLMGGEKADMVFCDAPYGYKYESNRQDKYEMLQNDDKILDFIPAIWGAMKDNCPVYEFCGWQSLKQWLEYFENTNLDLKNVIIWKKNSWSMGDLKGAYAGQYEVILYLNKGRVELNGSRDTDIWEFDREPPKMHPTMKPIELIAYALNKSSKKGDVVLDCFGGSGSTLIACEKTNRKCRIMELDPKYCDVIRKRWTKWAQENGRKVGSGGLE